MQFIPHDNSPFVPASHEDPNDPGVLKRVIATHEQLLEGRVQMLNWARLPVGGEFQRHYHEDMEEVFVLVSGQASMTVETETVEMQPGDTVVIAPREIHSMKNRAEVPAEYLVFGITTGQGGKTVVVN